MGSRALGAEAERKAKYHGPLGLLLMLGAVSCFVAMVTCVKLLREGGMSTIEVMVWRMAPGVPVLFLELRRRGARFWPNRPMVVGLRAIFGSLAMGTYFWAVHGLSLFQNTVIQLSQPIFVALLAPVILREQLKGTAVWALPLALGGAFIVIVSDNLDSPWTWVAAASLPLLPGLLRIASALFSSLAHMAIRLATTPNARIPHRLPDDPETVVIHFALWVSLAGTAIAIVQGRLGSLPDGLALGTAAWLIAGTAALGVAGQLLLSRAYARTQAPTVAIVGYAAIPMSLVADVLVWNTPLTWTHAVGTLVMVLAGVLLARGAPSAPGASSTTPESSRA